MIIYTFTFPLDEENIIESYLKIFILLLYFKVS